ncbi:ABC transporter substrate-binding protein [Caulobacter sp. S45]|jgi:phospholipid transport system substrate-binding protein|uniref:ABC transporter substrate-binding protein n=1 Tax=Caulobacter sp. S45 TaxID=1641861 RepID=UPI00131A94F3|nr:ABC transporter substrate-binding protein [Caulobacter sp. S45]
MHPSKSALFALASVAAFAAPALPVYAQASDPAAQQIESFDHTLLDAMKGGRSLGFQGRYRKLEPAVTGTFNLPVMIRFAVGPGWTTMAPADQSALLTAFTRYSVSTWAKNFDSYHGQKLVVGTVDTRGPDKLVHTKLVSSDGSDVDLTYRMRDSGGEWKVIDVYFNGAISQLSQQRSDYAATLQSGGPKALVKKINELSDKAAKG